MLTRDLALALTFLLCDHVGKIIVNAQYNTSNTFLQIIVSYFEIKNLNR